MNGCRFGMTRIFITHLLMLINFRIYALPCAMFGNSDAKLFLIMFKCRLMLPLVVLELTCQIGIDYRGLRTKEESVWLRLNLTIGEDLSHLT